MIPANAALAVAPLLADAETPFEHLGAHFRGDRVRLGADDLAIVALGVVAVAFAAWLLTRCLSRQDRLGRFNHPRKLFRALCRAHQLDWRSRLLLRQLVRSQRIEPPALIFVDSRYLAPERIDARLASQSARIDWLRERLFAREPATQPLG